MEPKQPNTNILIEQPSNKRNPLILTLVVLLIFLLGTTTYFAYRYFQLKKEITSHQSVPLTSRPASVSSPIPTNIVTSPTPKVSITESSSGKKITYKPVLGWSEYKSSTGYSFQYPPEFLARPVVQIEQEATYDFGQACSVSFADDKGDFINSYLMAYDGASRRSKYPINDGYSYQFSEITVQDINSLSVEGKAKDGSGTEKGIIIPVGNNILIIKMKEKLPGAAFLRTPEFNTLVGSILINQSLDFSKCGQ